MGTALAPLLPRLGRVDAATHEAAGIAAMAEARFADAIADFGCAQAGGDTSPTLRLNLAIAHDRLGNHEVARRLMRAVAGDMPDWDEPWLRLGESLRGQSRLEDAVDAYRQALERAPLRQESLISLGVLHLQLQDGVAAQTVLLRACGVAPLAPEAWDALGLALTLTGNLAPAVTAFGEAHRLAPGRLDIAMHLLNASAEAGTLGATLALSELECVANPANPVAHALRGLLLDRLGRRDEAIDAADIAATLAPDSAELVLLHGGLLARALRLREAATVLRRAQELDPTNPRLLGDLAAVLMRLHRPAESLRLLTEADEKLPGQDFILCNMATATSAQGRQEEALALARRAVQLMPQSMLAHRTLASVMPYVDGVSGAELTHTLIETAARMQRAPAAPIVRPDPHRRLRVGLMSGSFRAHPVGWLTIAGLEALPREQCDLVGFAAATWSDPMNRRFRAICSAWHDISLLDDAAAAALIRREEIDILIDFGGHGDISRMSVCALRPAPVQMKWVGMQFHTSGLPDMDWMITDRWETPPALAPLYTERLLTLPDGYVCYSPPADAPDVVPSPALANGFITFGCLNNPAKITSRVIEVWCAILRDLPTARLRLRAQQFGEAETVAAFHQRFAERGIASERVLIGGPLPHRMFMAEYNHVDIALDPFPSSGGLTTCEALWMGVPTIALPGESFASRHSLSHLSNVGLQDWVVGDVGAYRSLALRWAADLEGLAVLREGLRARVKASPLCDAPRFGVGLDRALRAARVMACAESQRETA